MNCPLIKPTPNRNRSSKDTPKDTSPPKHAPNQPPNERTATPTYPVAQEAPHLPFSTGSKSPPIRPTHLRIQSIVQEAPHLPFCTGSEWAPKTMIGTDHPHHLPHHPSHRPHLPHQSHWFQQQNPPHIQTPTIRRRSVPTKRPTIPFPGTSNPILTWLNGIHSGNDGFPDLSSSSRRI
jgi:hypothetical protein